MRCYLLLGILILFSCNLNQQNRNQKKTKIKSDNCFVYPSIIDSLQLKDLFDSARWLVYTLQCDKKYLPKNDTSISMTFGELPLSFRNTMIKHDSLEIIFEFTDKGQTILPSITRDYKETTTGVGFNIKTKTKIYMIFNGGTVTYKGSGSRYVNPLQPEVVNYIKTNWDKLNNCFRKLAEEKGIREDNN
jgi:hypothetical protein